MQILISLFSANRHFYCVIRIEETKLVCAIPRILLGWKTFLFCIGVLQFSWNYLKLVPNGTPHPHPGRGLTKTTTRQNYFFKTDFDDFWFCFSWYNRIWTNILIRITKVQNNILLYIILLGGGANNGPYYPPIPIPGVSKSFLPGGKQIKKEHILDDFYHFFKKSEKSLINHLETNNNHKNNCYPFGSSADPILKRRGASDSRGFVKQQK